VIPEEGITVSLLRQEGSAVLYASGRVRNPNSAFYDFRIDSEGEVYVDPQELFGDRGRRDSEDESSDSEGGLNMLYVSVEGMGSEINSFQITTSTGNTIGELQG
jgi:hypothetical protein